MNDRETAAIIAIKELLLYLDDLGKALGKPLAKGKPTERAWAVLRQDGPEAAHLPAKDASREWLNVLAILESIDEVPDMPDVDGWNEMVREMRREDRMRAFLDDPVRFLRRADDPTQAAIWAEVTRRLAGGA